MAQNEDGQIAGESFSQLLFAADDLGLDPDTYYNYTSSFSPQMPPKMLCFGDNRDDCEIATLPQKSGITCRNSSPASSTTTNASSKKKRNGSGKESIQSFVAGIGAPAGGQRNCRKRKSENPTVGGGSSGHGKVKRENLGERITALQQLVSPYGKTDTASVLHEAMGYIRFLQEQVQVLCSPYLKTQPSSLIHFHHQEGGENGGEEQPGKKDLSSRGLCLVPVECIAHVSNNNGADYWSPATMGNHVSPNH